MRALVGRNLPGGLRQRTMSGPGRDSGEDGAFAAWETYCRTVATADSDYPRTVYAHIARGSSDAGFVLQFWAYYYFNHFVNMHESDWECVVLSFASDPSAPKEPAEVAYSSHIGTIWRAWVDVPKRVSEDEVHPIVYVARGSHAQYFGSCPDGYDVQGALGAYASYYPALLKGIIRGRYSAATRDLPEEAMRETRDQVPNVAPMRWLPRRARGSPNTRYWRCRRAWNSSIPPRTRLSGSGSGGSDTTEAGADRPSILGLNGSIVAGNLRRRGHPATGSRPFVARRQIATMLEAPSTARKQSWSRTIRFGLPGSSPDVRSRPSSGERARGNRTGTTG